MVTERMLVLASSRKLGARCVAGLSLLGNGLVRPVSESGDGQLWAHNHQLAPPPAEFDVVVFDHNGSAGDIVQPENLVLEGRAWTSEGAMSPTDALPHIEPHLHTGRMLFENNGAAVHQEQADLGMDASLCVVEPDAVRFEVTADIRARVKFTHRRQAWDLPLTDFRVANVMRRTRPGNYSLDDLGLGDPERVMLLLSLGARNDVWHSKLVASVLQFP